MSLDIENKINSLQKNFSELNSLFELSSIANQAFTIKDLIKNLDLFLKKALKVNNVYFFTKSQNYFHFFNGYTNFEIDIKDNDFLSIFNGRKIINLKKENGEIKYKTLWEKYDLHILDIDYGCTLQDNDLINCILFFSFENREKLSSSDVNYLNRIFAFIEPVFTKLNQREQKQKELKDLNKALHNISILYNISQAVNFIDDLKRLLKVILDKAIETTEAERGSLMLYDYTDNALQVKVVYGLKDKNVENDINNGIIECSKLKPGEGIAGSVFFNKTPIVTNLGQSDPRFKKGVHDINSSSLLCVPLIVKNEAIGVINISNKKNNKFFTRQDMEFMEALANQAAIAIDNAKLYELATKDGLTKLYIYRHFYALLETEIQRSLRYQRNMSLLMMDIDFFKNINDSYGHLLGDQILREISSVINSTIRKIDVAARYGGEEFAIILPETSAKSARVIAERLRKNIENMRLEISEEITLQTTVSIGISEFPLHGETAKDIINCADIALYEAKRNGRNCTYQYDNGSCIKVSS